MTGAAALRRRGAFLVAAALATGLANAFAAAPEPAASPAAASLACATSALPNGAAEASFAVARWPDRDYDVLLPDAHRCDVPIGLVVILHGGGGNRTNMRKLTCPDGDVTSSGCLFRRALAAGFAVAFADGTAAAMGAWRGGLRTWNAGGGRDGAICVSGRACRQGVDDVAYFRALLAEVETRIDLDPRRVFVTGFSNGAAMAQRLGCEASDRVAAIAPVSGENQFALTGCTPSAPVSVLDIHGTLDKCWPYAGGPGGCIESGRYVSVEATLAGWAARNGCAAVPVRTPLAVTAVAPDGTSIIQHSYSGCAAGGDLVHLEITGHGHYWPDGWSYARKSLLGGTMSRQLDANETIIAFFATHARP